MKKLCSLFALGMLLFWAACSEENVSPVSGSTEDPNMVTADTSMYVHCSRIASGKSQNSEDSGCYWSGEMWNRTSGYRVHTGYDNGTNTSGIWTWSVNALNDSIVHTGWNFPLADTDDSTALADVIDKCNGSLCGTIEFKQLPDSLRYVPVPSREITSFTLKFSLAGKDSSGKFESVDVHDMQGICIEYIAVGMEIELDLGDSLNTVMAGYFYNVKLPYYPKENADGGVNGKEVCYPWNSFVLPRDVGIKGIPISMDEALSHLQGFRFTISTNYNYGYPVSEYFDIISLGRYSGTAPATNLHSVDKSCSPDSVRDYFCECSYPDERSERKGFEKTLRYINEKIGQIKNESSIISDKTEKCFGHIPTPYITETHKVVNWERPCDNPLPKTLVCADGSVSESREFTQMMEIFDAKANVVFEQQKLIVDSLFGECMKLRDTLFNGEIVPDSCRIDEILMDRSVHYLPYTKDASVAANAAFIDELDSLSKLDSLDEASKYCVLQFNSREPRLVSSLQKRPLAEPFITHPMVKSIRCESGNVYYTSEYKEFLQELGLKDDTDSLDVYNAAKKYYLDQRKNALDNCVDSYGKNGIIWDAVWTKVNTGFDNGSGTSGKWFYVTDSADGGKSHIEWNNGYVVKDWNDPNALDTLLRNDGQLKGSAYFVKTSIRTPFVNLGFWLAGEDGKGDHDAVDITDKEGICLDFDLSSTGFTSTGFTEVYLQLDMSDSLGAAINFDLFSARLRPTYSTVLKCYVWEDFRQAGWGKKMELKEALKHVTGIKFHFEYTGQEESVVDFSIKRIAFKNPYML